MACKIAKVMKHDFLIYNVFFPVFFVRFISEYRKIEKKNPDKSRAIWCATKLIVIRNGCHKGI